MHGRPRQRVLDSAADEDQAKAQLVESLLAAVLKNHHDKCYTKEALAENAHLVELNPEINTAWNFRKLALKHLLDAAEDDDARRKLVREDLKVNENALRANIKSYGAWHHRKWLINLGLSSLDNEFALLKQLFKVDARNFHAWGYRRYIVSVKGVPVEQELDYTTQLINDNFSNYSAWHNRSALLTNLFKDNQSDKTNEEILNEEFNSATQAFFVDPSDQSAWIYHSWLIDKSRNMEQQWEKRIDDQIVMCRELLEIEEEESKWPKLTLARLLKIRDEVENSNEIKSIFEDLTEIDSTHQDYYKDMLSKLVTC